MVSTKLRKMVTADESGTEIAMLRFSWQDLDSLGSIGILPRKGMEKCSAKSFPPSLEKILVHS